MHQNRLNLLRTIESRRRSRTILHANHAVDWDGSNYTGSYDEDLYYELQRLLDERYNYNSDANTGDVWDWLFSSGATLSDVWPADESLDDAVERLEEDAVYVTLRGGTIRDALIDRILNDEDPDELIGEHLRVYNEWKV